MNSQEYKSTSRQTDPEAVKIYKERVRQISVLVVFVFYAIALLVTVGSLVRFFMLGKDFKESQKNFYDVCLALHNGTHCDQFWTVFELSSTQNYRGVETLLVISVVSLIFAVIVFLRWHRFLAKMIVLTLMTDVAMQKEQDLESSPLLSSTPSYSDFESS